MNLIERFFRRRALARDPVSDQQLPPGLKAMPLRQIVAINGYNWRVMHRRVQPDGSAPAVVLQLIGPTHRTIKTLGAKMRRGVRHVFQRQKGRFDYRW